MISLVTNKSQMGHGPSYGVPTLLNGSTMSRFKSTRRRSLIYLTTEQGDRKLLVIKLYNSLQCLGFRKTRVYSDPL